MTSAAASVAGTGNPPPAINPQSASGSVGTAFSFGVCEAI